MLESLFLGCFVFGLLFTFATAALGASHVGGFDHAGHVAGDAGPHLGPFAQLNLSALMAFVMWFGGAGWLMLRFSPLGLLGALPVGLVAGLAAYRLIAAFFRLLHGSAQEARAEDYVLEGTVARVTVPVAVNGVGEIVFMLQGAQRVEGARTADGQPLPKGAEVVITGFERGLAVVEDARRFVQNLPEAPPVRRAEPDTETGSP